MTALMRRWTITDDEGEKMRGNLEISGAVARLRSRALGTTALTVVAIMASSAAWAQPPANSLPGSFSTNDGNAGYTYTSATTTGTITTGTAQADVLQWGGTALTNSGTNGGKVPAPSGATTNTGFSIGSGATLTINGTATSVLITDQTGSASEIYGTLTSGLGATAPLYVSNTNGIIVGSTGVITATAAGVGLLGYAVDPTTFAGTLNISSATSGTGSVTIAAGATINGGTGVATTLLVASNGTVNIGADSTVTGSTNYVLAGYGFTTTTGSVTPTPGSAFGSSSAVNVTGGSTATPLTLTLLDAAGGVTNSGVLTQPATLNVAGLFTNNGVLNTLGTLTLTGTGNFQNKGVLNLEAAGSLTVQAANIDLGGSVTIANKALNSSTGASANQLASLTVQTLNKSGEPSSQAGGVVDVATQLYTTGGATVQGNAIRVLSGGITDVDGSTIFFVPGTGAAKVADPFFGLTSLGYTFSLFPGTLISSASATGTGAITVEDADINGATNTDGSMSFATSSGLNLDGQLSAQNITVAANNIHSNNGLSGGFMLPNKGVLQLIFYGDVNNPAGAAANGATSFLYNYVPVTVGASGSKAGTVEISLAGPSPTSPTEQFVNLLVQGNAQFLDGAGDGLAPSQLTEPTVPTAVQSSYANNHLVVTATGNIGFDPSAATQPSQANSLSVFYWPGLVYLTAGATTSDPAALPASSSTASIALGDASGTFTGGTPTTVNLSNLLAADLTTASVGGQIGMGGVHFLTNTLNLSPGTGGGAGTATVTISNDSWANFINASTASAFQLTNGSQFFGGTISGSVVNTSKLPASDFQPQ